MSDTVYCPEGRHHVPRDMMTVINTSKPGIKRRACTDCKDRVIDARKAAAMPEKRIS